MTRIAFNILAISGSAMLSSVLLAIGVTLGANRLRPNFDLCFGSAGGNRRDGYCGREVREPVA
jgi:hypothetical protein